MPSRSVAWLLLVAAATAVFVTGVVTTASILSQADDAAASVRGNWIYVTIAAAFTLDLPDFLPQCLAGFVSPLEQRLERPAFAPDSTHYMAVLQKPA